nr:hypothetical protein [Tanacetum cinerariifolium]
MATTIEQQVALDEALIPSTKRLRIGRSNFRLPSDIQSKESTLQVEFWATYYVHQYSIGFKIDSKNNIVDLETFRDMLHISPRISGQSFDELPFEEEILDFLWFLRHSAQIKTLTDVNKLFQPWRSFAAVINKCLTRKSFGFDSFRLSQAQILWGLYHKRNINYAFLIWEYFVYQVEHKNQKKSNEMYYPRFKKVIIHHFMTKKPSIPRRNKVNWHYVRDDILFSTIKVLSRHQNTKQYVEHKNQKKSNEMYFPRFTKVIIHHFMTKKPSIPRRNKVNWHYEETIKVLSRHQNTKQYGAILPIELTNDEIRNTKAYKEYYACATRKAAPKPKASARRKMSDSDTSITPPTAIPTPITTVATAPMLTAAAKGKQPAKAKSPSDPSEVARTEA